MTFCPVLPCLSHPCSVPNCVQHQLRSYHIFVFSTAHFNAKDAGDLSTLFDVGGIIGEALPCSASRLHFSLVVERDLGR